MPLGDGFQLYVTVQFEKTVPDMPTTMAQVGSGWVRCDHQDEHESQLPMFFGQKSTRIQPQWMNPTVLFRKLLYSTKPSFDARRC